MIYQGRILISNFLQSVGLNADWSGRLAQILIVASLFVVGFIIAGVFRRWVKPLILKYVERTETKWDDYLVNEPVLNALGWLIPSVFVYSLLANCYDSQYATTYVIISRLVQVNIAYAVTRLITSFLKALNEAVIEHTHEQNYRSIVEFARLVVFTLGGIVMVSLLLGYAPLRFIAGLGAAATVLMLVFKDSIMGLVAGIQLNVNKMLKEGDWITIDKLHVNGYVKKISLTTVKIQNFDNSIVTVPPYTLVSDSFQNWTGIYVEGTRRVKRSVNVDLTTVHTLSKDEAEALRHKKLLTGKAEGDERMTNLTAYRHHIAALLRTERDVSDRQWMLVRTLAPTTQGIPVEFWFYVKETEFTAFEERASVYMERFLALLPEFGLKAFQANIYAVEG